MKEALLIIDVQNDYFEGGKTALVGADKAAENARLVLDMFRSKGLPIAHVQHIATSPTATFFLPNTEGAEIYKGVSPMDGEKVVVKHYPNSFRETDLLGHLKAEGITDVVICGMMTHMCVDATTRAAKDFGFSCTVIGDACATRTLEVNGQSVAAAEVQKSFLAALSYFYSTVKTAKQYIEER